MQIEAKVISSRPATKREIFFCNLADKVSENCIDDVNSALFRMVTINGIALPLLVNIANNQSIYINTSIVMCIISFVTAFVGWFPFQRTFDIHKIKSIENTIIKMLNYKKCLLITSGAAFLISILSSSAYFLVSHSA